MKNNVPYFVNSVSELHTCLNIKKPTHPLVSVVNFEDIAFNSSDEVKTMVYDFYTVYFKKNFDGRVNMGSSITILTMAQ